MFKRALVPIALAAASVAATMPSNGASIVISVATDQGPASFAVHPTTGIVYVGNVTDGTVAILAGAAAVTKINVENPVGLAVDAAANKLYVASFAAQKVFVYSTVTYTKLAEFAVGGHPWGLDVDQATGRVFVANFESNRLQVLQRDSLTSITEVALPGCAGPIGVAYNAATSRTFVTCVYSGTVAVVSSSLTPMQSINLGLGTYPRGVASHPTGTLVYIGTWGGGDASAGGVSVIDADTRAVLATAETHGAPVGLAVSRGGTPYVALSGVNKLGILNPSTGAVEETVELPTDPKDGMNEPQAVAVSPTGALVYVGNYHVESVSVINALPRT
jgi:YVTN family beta-propeller protein